MSFIDSIINFFKKLFGVRNNIPTPLPPLPTTPMPTSQPGVSKVNVRFNPATASFYSPTVIASDGFNMWVTNGDRVSNHQSTDGVNWSGGNIVMSANPGWEDDGGNFLGYRTGISDPRILKNVTPGYAYTMYYTAGHAPNTETSGGIGCAVSNDGINWSRVGSGMLRHFPGGNCFIIQAITIAGKRYLYYLGGGNATVGPSLMVADDAGDGIHFENDRVLTGVPSTYIPLFYDEGSGSCWAAVGSGTSVPSGPIGFDIYKGSDGFTTLGTKVATIDSSITGNQTNFDPQALQRTDQGKRFGSGPVQIIFSTGNTWGNWTPASVIINA